MAEAATPKRPLSEAERAQLASKLDNELDDFINSMAEKRVGS